MGDPKSTTESYSQLPPGSRFYPSEEQLVCCYLPCKNRLPSPSASRNPNSSCDNGSLNVIQEIKLYNYDPFDLPDFTCFRFGYRGRKRHWYCYTETINGGGGEMRAAGCGFWKRKGRARDVMGSMSGGGTKVILGRRSCFVFYMEKGLFDQNKKKDAVRTDWTMYEYALIDNVEASFVLCRVFVKSHGRNNASEHGLSSCAEESAATVRHVGVQHDGIISDIDEVGADNRGCDGCKSAAGISAENLRDSLYFTSDIQQNNLVRSSGLVGAGQILGDAIGPHQTRCILEGDFIELDDLV